MAGLWLLLAFAAARPGDAGSLLLTETSGSNSSVAQTIIAAESEALPLLLEALERARALGVDNASLSGTEAALVSRAAADLSLLSELTAVAGSHLPHLSPSLKAALATSEVDTQRINDAFSLAERAGVPQEEVLAARQALNSEISQRLAQAAAAVGSPAPAPSGNVSETRRLTTTSLASKMEDLAYTIHLANQLNYEGDDVLTARQAFTTTLEANLGTTDMDFVERVAAVADISNARVPMEFREWAGVMQSLREALNMDENKTESLHTLMRVMTKAKEEKMPTSVPEFVAVKEKAQTCCLLTLGNIMSGLDPNSTSAGPGVVDMLLAELAKAELLEVPSSSLALATAKVKALASAELQAALAADLPDASEVRADFEKVALAGVSASEIDSQKALLESKIMAKLGSAIASTGLTVTAANVEALAAAINAAAAFDYNSTEIATARSIYKQVLAGPFNSSSTSVFETVVELAEQAGVGVPQQMMDQFGALRRAQTASGLPACQEGELRTQQEFLVAFRRARDSSLTSYPPVLDVKAKAQNCAVIALNTTAVDVRSIDVYLGLLDTAREVGVPEASLADAVSTIQAVTSTYLNEALAKNPVDADEVHDAFGVADRAGMSASEISTKASALANQTLARFQAAQATLTYSNSSTSAIAAIKELAMVIAVGLRVEPVEEALRTTVATGSRHAGEGALLLRFGTKIDVEVNKKAIAHMSMLDRTSWPDGVKDVLPTYASLFVSFDPLKVSRSDVMQWCGQAVAAESSDQEHATDAPRVISIPVHYGGEDGPDIDEAAVIAGLSSAEEVARLHASGDYRVYFLGFLGGFPYLGGLPAALAKVPRLTTPRQKLPKGTVGVAGGQTGVYTISTPGGWYCLGRTQKKLFDPSQDPPAMLRAGDLIKFVSVDEAVEEEAAEVEPPLVPARPCIEIVAPGPLTTVQDLGRYGYARHGVSRSGAADDLALRMGNVLLGNEEGAAGLEVTMGGLKIRCVDPCAIALTGADCGAKLRRPRRGPPRSLCVNEAVMLQSDDEVELGFPKDGMRAYVCVRGGVDVPLVLGSRSTDIRAAMGGFQGRSLRSGDTIGRLGSGDADAEPSRQQLLKAAHDPLRSSGAGGEATSSGKTWHLRVLPGPGDPETDTVHSTQLQALAATTFKVLPRADRMAVCIAQEGKDQAKAAAKQLQGIRDIPYGLSEYTPPEMMMGTWSTAHLYDLLVGGQQMSEGTVSGTVQLPPDGNPVILLAEHQTTGGYKVPAVVIQADLWQVGQMRPGDSIRFAQTTPEDAVSALHQLRAQARETKTCSIESWDACSSQAADELEALEVNGAGKHLKADESHGHQPAPSSIPARSSRLSSAGLGGLWAASKLLWPSFCRSPGLARGHASLVPRTGPETKQIDLNADCGEGFDDAGLLEYVTSVNIACGAHAGTTESIAEVVRLAAACNAGVGAHVSFVDREGFGRRALGTPPQELFDQVLWQASALDGLCRGAGTRVRYVKPHGALYHAVMAGGEQGQAVLKAAEALQLPLLLMPWSPWAGYGEGFAERRYDGEKLRSREKEGAVIHEPHEAAEQAVSLAAQAKIHSICVHGDSPNAVVVARAVRAALEREYELRPFCPA